MLNNYEYEYGEDIYYCYPNSLILKNKMGITDGAELKTVERRITALNQARIKEFPVVGSFDFEHLKAIHKALFGDIYEWAGQIRTINVIKGNLFCLSNNIDVYAESIFNKLKNEKYLMIVNKEQIPERLSYYLSEINVLHPFREGNGRTQRTFIEYLASCCGYHLDFSLISPQEMIKASANAFNLDYDDMNSLFARIITPCNICEQKRYITAFGKQCPEIKKLFLEAKEPK